MPINPILPVSQHSQTEALTISHPLLPFWRIEIGATVWGQTFGVSSRVPRDWTGRNLSPSDEWLSSRGQQLAQTAGATYLDVFCWLKFRIFVIVEIVVPLSGAALQLRASCALPRAWPCAWGEGCGGCDGLRRTAPLLSSLHLSPCHGAGECRGAFVCWSTGGLAVPGSVLV